MAFGHIADSDSIALWRFDEASDTPFANSAPGGLYPLAQYGDYDPMAPTTSPRAHLMPGILGFSRCFIGSQTPRRVIASDFTGTSVLRPLFFADWTTEAWVFMTGVPSDGFGLICTWSGLGGTESNNTPMSVYVLTNGKVRYYTKHDGGIEASAQSTGVIPLYAWTHIAVRKRVVTGTATVDFFINGVLDSTVTGITLPTGATDDTKLRWHVGSNANYAETTFNGAIDEIHVSKVARSDAYILADALRVPLIGGSIVDPTAPVVSNLVPAPGTSIYPGTALQLDVTDNQGLFRRIILTAQFPNGANEVVFDGATFAANYGTSTVTNITNGKRFFVRRAGGWPASPTLSAFAIDQAGNEGT